MVKFELTSNTKTGRVLLNGRQFHKDEHGYHILLDKKTKLVDRVTDSDKVRQIENFINS